MPEKQSSLNPSGTAKESFFQRWENRLLGIRKGFGEEGDLLKVAKLADGRSLSVLTIPVTTLIVFLIFHLLLVYNGILLNNKDPFSMINFGGMLFRIFVFDYLIFIFGACSGLDCCRRWRKSASRVEELSLSPLMPAVVGNSLIIGALRWWLIACLAFAVVEILLGYPLYVSLQEFILLPSIASVSRPYYFTLFVVAYFVGPLAFAYFHFESARLAHWMFSQHALPKSKLLSVGFQNFILINIIVAVLSAFGSLLTFGFFAILIIFPSAFFGIAFDLNPFEAIFSSYFTWYVSAIPAAFLIGKLKSWVSKDFENKFTNSWLLYQWWGAGELSQPQSYPRRFRQTLPFWQLFYKAAEEENANIPLQKQRYGPRYRNALKAVQTEKGKP